MSQTPLGEVLSPFWLPGLQDQSRRTTTGLHGWLDGGQYQVYTPITPRSFVLQTVPVVPLVAAFAHDASRFSCASFESCQAIGRIPATPRATAWLMIKAYYAAFYAAHALIRFQGAAVINADRSLADAVELIASAYGQTHGVSIDSGCYHLKLDYRKTSLGATYSQVGSAGIHESFWRVFYRHLNALITDVLANIPGRPGQDAARQLQQLADILSNSGATGGQWLSTLRNQVNYRLELGCWHPYGVPSQRAENLFRMVRGWRSEASAVSLMHGRTDDLERFLSASMFLVALCRETVLALATRTAPGTSYLRFGALGYLDLSGATS